jgi:ketosteroid isomerase-like protein
MAFLHSPGWTARLAEGIPRPRGDARKAGPDGSRAVAVVFRVTDGQIDAVTEYCDTSYMKRVLFDQ